MSRVFKRIDRTRYYLSIAVSRSISSHYSKSEFVRKISNTHKEATKTATRRNKDYQFLIQRYTGCREGEAAGLRHCDIDLKEKLIHFKQSKENSHLIDTQRREKEKNTGKRI